MESINESWHVTQLASGSFSLYCSGWHYLIENWPSTKSAWLYTPY